MNQKAIGRFLGYAVLFAIGIALYSLGARDLAQDSKPVSPNVGGTSIITVLIAANISD